MKVVCDVEADNLWPMVKNLWCVVCIDIDTLKVYKFRPWELYKFKEFANGVELWIGHNFMDYDAKVLKRFLDVMCGDVLDTMILSRLDNPKRMGGHSLANLGKIVGHHKSSHDDFTKYTEEMLTYCVQDCKVTYYVYMWLMTNLERYSRFSISLEHDIQVILNEQRDNGFHYEYQAGIDLRMTLDARRAEIDRFIKDTFPPEVTETIKIAGIGNKKLGRVKGEPYIVTTTKEFNLKSPKHVVAKLNESGWTPTIRTVGALKAIGAYGKKQIDKDEYLKKTEHGWKLCEENYATIPEDAPEGLRSIGEYLMLRSRLDKLDEALRAVKGDSRVHGTCISLGASTHRAAHYDPQMGNQPGVQSVYGKEIRRLFSTPEGSLLIGTDASGIQARLLAHYIGDDAYSHRVSTEDVHEVHRELLGLPTGDESRGISKTFYYAMIFGGGDAKLKSILGGDAKQAIENLYSHVPGLEVLRKTTVGRWLKDGFLVALDGRLIDVPSYHLALSRALQGGEKIVMALANVLWHKEAKRRGMEFKQVCFNHDEWETEVPDDLDKAHELGRIQEISIKKAGEILNVRCPLAGEHKVGKDWYDVH